MIAVDLSATAREEAKRLSAARALLAEARQFDADGPLVGIARRRRVRSVLQRRVLLLYRCAYEDGCGRLVHSTLAAVTIVFRDRRIKARDVDWPSIPLPVEAVDGSRPWRDSAERVTRVFTSTRLSRERAIAAALASARTAPFQPGLFDRRADRAQTARERDAADFSRRQAARVAAIESAGALTLRPAELLLVIIPSDAAWM